MTRWWTKRGQIFPKSCSKSIQTSFNFEVVFQKGPKKLIYICTTFLNKIDAKTFLEFGQSGHTAGRKYFYRKNLSYANRFFKLTIPGHFFIISKSYSDVKCSVILADTWIRTVDLWCRIWLLYQRQCHKHWALRKLFFCKKMSFLSQPFLSCSITVYSFSRGMYFEKLFLIQLAVYR